MKKLMIYLPLLLFCMTGFQLKAEENTNITNENPVITENEIVVQDVVNTTEKKELQAHEVGTNIFSYLDNLFRYAVIKK